MVRYLLAVLSALLVCGTVRAGLYYSGEVYAELPSQWGGFLLDQRILRNIAIKATDRTPANPAREKYQEAAALLEKHRTQRDLSADELADLGAIYLRLGEVERGLTVLRQAHRSHPQHFRIAANLGTAWQLHGDLAQAAAILQEAVRLAPASHRRAEEHHLKLIQFRQRDPRDTQRLDDLFGVGYADSMGRYQVGGLAEAERKKLPPDAVAIAQQLALWFPADGRLLWQVAELANAYGDMRKAASMMDGCVTELGMHAPQLRAHRQQLRASVEEITKLTAADLKIAHDRHTGSLVTRSKRPLQSRLDRRPLPPIRVDGINELPWSTMSETIVTKTGKPEFAKHVESLNGRTVMLTGFMQPLDGQPEVSEFLLVENPIGCWFCEMPDVSGLVMVSLKAGKAVPHVRGLMKVVGKLRLNVSDPESFLYTIDNADVREAD
jgi:tetratricopeptide (TPR) repeat protein